MIALTPDQLDVLLSLYRSPLFYDGDRFFRGELGLCSLDTTALAFWSLVMCGLIVTKKYLIGDTICLEGYVLSRRAEEIVKRREPLRLTIELISKAAVLTNPREVADIVRRIPFAQLPQILACDDDYIRELASRRLRKRAFFSRMG